LAVIRSLPCEKVAIVVVYAKKRKKSIDQGNVLAFSPD